MVSAYVDIALFQLTREQCIQAREMLGWNIQRLADESGVTPLAIEQYESGFRKLRPISRQAIAFAFETQALMFIPGYAPTFGDNVRGACPDPRGEPDYNLLE
jgi:transcriptional regulator with XRE-family HTH domain